MTITPIIEEPCFRTKITYYHIKPKVPSPIYVIFLHGQGELGPLDGSNLAEVLKLGWPMHAKNGFEFPWNMIVPQSQYDHRNLIKLLVPYVKLKYKASGLFVTGLSLGGYGTYDAVLYDTLGLINAIGPVCGSGRLASVASYGRMKAFHIHGENDSTVKWNTARAFIEKYNETAVWPIKYHVYPGVGHNVWNQAYSVKPGEDELYQWFLERIEELPAEPLNTQAMKDKIIEFVKTA
jgi:predicted peptidase